MKVDVFFQLCAVDGRIVGVEVGFYDLGPLLSTPRVVSPGEGKWISCYIFRLQIQPGSASELSPEQV